MKAPEIPSLALLLTVLVAHVQAHPGHDVPQAEKAYVVSWIGTAPKAGIPVHPADRADFWKQAFVSKYRIVSASFPVLAP